MTEASYRYSAFISYNHRDQAHARWLLKALESWRVPKRLRGLASPVGVLGARLPPVFRDRDELATSSDLAQSVRDALDASAHLIVLCSPNGAASRWVNAEIRHFTALGRRDRIRCLIVGGIPNASDPVQECLPPALFEDGGSEPMAADICPGGDGRTTARLKLIAGIIGVGYNDLARREAQRRMRRMTLALGASSVALVAMAALSTFAFMSRAEAVQQRDIARQKTLTAERTVDFVKTLFTTSDPSESRGATITAREILDLGAKRIGDTLHNEPTVKAELTTTLGEVYAGLGLYREGDRILLTAIALKGVEPMARARQYAALGESLARQGDYEKAGEVYRLGLKVGREADPKDIARLLTGFGEVQSAQGAFDDARQTIERSRAIEKARLPAGDPGLARPLEALAVNASMAGRQDEARKLLEQAIALRIPTQGETHPVVTENLNNLGAIAYLQQDSPAAEAYYRQVMAVERKVLGERHPALASTYNNLSRILLEQRQFAEARELLRAAVAISLRERSETFDDMAFLFANLALAEQGLGRLEEAERLFEKAWTAAELHQHRNRGPILVDRADIACTKGRADEGRALLNRADPIIAADYPDDPWRSAFARTVRAHCFSRAGKEVEARAMLKPALPAIFARWPAGSLYAVRATEIARNIGN